MSEPSLQHEPDVTSAGRLWIIMLATVGLVLVSSLAVWLVLDHYHEPALSPRFHEDVKEPAWPLLQQDPTGDLGKFNQGMSGRLNSSGWINREEGIVHMPVERAMSLLVERGLPGESP